LFIDLLNWIWIAGTAYLTGYAVFRVVDRRTGNVPVGIDGTLVAGSTFLTAYSEFFSLFSGVGVAASFILLALCLLILLVCRQDFQKQWIADRKYLQDQSRSRLFFGIVLLFLLVFYLAVSAMQPSSYDDYLYHAQALEWIERYGAVPGLGNLHFRLAYNSSFLCLQALFSWSWLLGQSLHTVNALYAFLLSAYCVSSFSFVHGRRTVLTSDLLKLIALVYLFYDTSVLSGLDTDPLAMMTVIYIFIKWAELIEQKEESGMPYALLSLLAVYACTLKLSCGALVLLALYPLWIFVKKRQGRMAGFCFIAAAIILLPYLIRNVILSGYLLYPMNTIDLFPVDWKMPVYMLVEDRQGILIWGRSLNSLLSQGKSWAEVAAMPFVQWFPIWFSSISHIQQLLLVLAFLSVIDFLIHQVMYLIRRKRPDNGEFILLIGICCFLFWLFSAPLIRYGSLYMMIVAGCGIGVYHKKVNRIMLCMWAVLLAVELSKLPAGSMLRPEDYEVSENLVKTSIESDTSLDDIRTETADEAKAEVYYPETGDKTDYEHFPSSPSYDMVENIKLRGQDIKDGFQSRKQDKK
jgi:hypothetical protein